MFVFCLFNTQVACMPVSITVQKTFIYSVYNYVIAIDEP